MCTLCLPRNYFVYVAVFTAHTGAFIAGTVMTWPSPVLPKLLNLEDNPLGKIITPTEISILGSIPVAGSLISTFTSGYLTRRFGRRPVLMLLGIPTILSNFLMLIATHVWMLYLGRLIAGITLGAFLAVDAMYFAEVAENTNRGFLGTAMVSFMNAGLVFVLAIGPWTSFYWFHVILGILPIISVVLVYMFVPESPYYLVQKDYEKAAVSLRKLRGVDDVKIELDNIKQSLKEESEVRLSQILRNMGLRKSLLIGCGLITFQQLTGFIVISSYCQLILDGVEGGVSSQIGPVIIIGLQSLVCLITPLFMDKSGRKVFLMISHLGMALAESIFGLYFYMKDNGENVSSLSWLPITSLSLTAIAYSLGTGPIPWSIIGEIFPLEVKEVATSVCTVVNLIVNFMVVFSYNYVIEFIGIGPTFWIFSCSGILATVFVRFYVIETKGKSLSEIQKELNT